MKRLVLCGILLFAGFSALTTACGSRSSDDEYPFGANAGTPPVPGAGSNAAGSTSTAGAPGAGTIGTSSGGAVAVGGTSQGGSATSSGGAVAIGVAGAPSAGGTVAAGGAVAIGGANQGGNAAATSSGGISSAGAGSAVAGGANNSACPVASPQRNDRCGTAALTCSYVGARCTCQQVGPNLGWRCTGSGAACPSGEPAASSGCMGNLRCPYPSGDECDCQNGSWGCFTPGCPASKPLPGGSCGGVGGRQQCMYGAGTACVCVAGAWFCNS